MGASASVGDRRSVGSLDELDTEETRRGSFALPFGRSAPPPTVPENGLPGGLESLDPILSPAYLRKGLAILDSDVGQPFHAPDDFSLEKTPKSPHRYTRGLSGKSPEVTRDPTPISKHESATTAKLSEDANRDRRRAFGSRKSFQKLTECPELEDLLKESETPDIPKRGMGFHFPTPAQLAAESLSIDSLPTKVPIPSLVRQFSGTHSVVPFDKSSVISENRRKGFNSRESFDDFLKVSESMMLDTETPREPFPLREDTREPWQLTAPALFTAAAPRVGS